MVVGLQEAWLLSLTGALGGHLAGAPTAFSALLRPLGQGVYPTFQVPTWVVGVRVLLAIALAVPGCRRLMRKRGQGTQ